MNLLLEAIRLDGNTQPRQEINLATVDEYAEAMAAGATFPPIIVFHDGANYWLADGFHRFHALRKNGMADWDVDLRQGTQRDARLFSLSANATHGLRRSNEDKRKSVSIMLEDAEWAQWSNYKIASHCAVSEPLVRSLRLKRSDSVPAAPVTERKFVSKQGIETYMKVANIGRREPKSDPPEPKAEPKPAEEPPLAPSLSSEMEDELQMARDVAEDLAHEVETLRAAASVEGAEAEIKRLKAMLKAVEAERDEYRTKANEAISQCKALQRKLERMEKASASG